MLYFMLYFMLYVIFYAVKQKCRYPTHLWIFIDRRFSSNNKKGYADYFKNEMCLVVLDGGVAVEIMP